MRRNDDHDHGSHHVRRALGLGLSGVALAGLIYFEGMPARAEMDEAEAALDLDVYGLDEVALNTVPEASTIAAPAPADERLAMAAIDAAEAMMPIGPPLPPPVAVPNIEGMDLRNAREQLAAVGLKLAVRDTYGDKVPRDEWSDYQVRRQQVEAGTEVAPGSTVKVKAAYRNGHAMGY